MSQEDANELIASLEAYVEQTTSSSEKALETLVSAGIVKTNGELEETY